MRQPTQQHFPFRRLTTLLLALQLSTLPCRAIINGINLNITDAPFMLSFRLNGDHVCGAAVISPDWGITAAHCIYHFMHPHNLTVRSGSAERDNGGVIHNVVREVLHPEYKTRNEDYDIAVFMVDPPFEVSDTTAPIQLPPNSDETLKTPWASVAGWGGSLNTRSLMKSSQQSAGRPLSQNLQYAQVPQITKTECIDMYKSAYILTPRQTCYGYKEGGPDTCKGDSGGPLYNSNNILIGVTSWGDACGEKYTPGVYTDVTLMTDWVRNVTDV